MNRRRFLRTAGAAGAVAGSGGLAGCLGFEVASGSGAPRAPPIVEDRPDAVYVPSHVEGMKMAGMGESNGYKVGVFYSYAHRFWNVNGQSVEKTSIGSGDDVHLMSSVWDPETGQVLPETGLSVEVSKGDELVSQEVIYPMLSQPMGFHYGANFGLDGDGDYTVTVSVGGVRTRRTGAYRDKFAQPADIPVDFSFSQSTLEEIEFRTLDNAGEKGAVDPMQMEGVPDAMAPKRSELPGRVVGEANSNDAVLVATVLDEPPAGINASGPYLAVSARTPYNRMLVPAMGLEATLSAGGGGGGSGGGTDAGATNDSTNSSANNSSTNSTTDSSGGGGGDSGAKFSGELVRTLDPELSYHYGAALEGASVASGDELTLSPTVWPQTARHEGYETAFGGLMGGMPERTITVE